MSRRRLPEIPKASLRDYDSSEQSAAVWRRLKSDLRAQPARTPFAVALDLGARARPQCCSARVCWWGRVSFDRKRCRSCRPSHAPHPCLPRVQCPRKIPLSLRFRCPRPRCCTRTRVVQRGSARRPSRTLTVSLDPSSYAVPTQAPAPEWQRLVEIGDFPGARRALDRQGGFDVAMAHASPSELMSLVDIARASGERGQAISALRQVLAHPEAPEAPLAAWTLGNLLEQAGDQPGAAQAFALYRRLSPAGDFAEDAAARQVDVALREGNLELVTQLASDYARDFPHGRRLSEFRRAERALSAGATKTPAQNRTRSTTSPTTNPTRATGRTAPAPSRSAPESEAH